VHDLDLFDPFRAADLALRLRMPDPPADAAGAHPKHAPTVGGGELA
jgi:hypothetical protein